MLAFGDLKMRRSRRIFLLFLALGSLCKCLAVQAQVSEGFRQVLPGDIKWLPSNVVPGGKVAILLGDPDTRRPAQCSDRTL